LSHERLGYFITESITMERLEQGDITNVFSFCNDLPLNETNKNVRIHFFEYWEINNKTTKKN